MMMIFNVQTSYTCLTLYNVWVLILKYEYRVYIYVFYDVFLVKLLKGMFQNLKNKNSSTSIDLLYQVMYIYIGRYWIIS